MNAQKKQMVELWGQMWDSRTDSRRAADSGRAGLPELRDCLAAVIADAFDTAVAMHGAETASQPQAQN